MKLLVTILGYKRVINQNISKLFNIILHLKTSVIGYTNLYTGIYFLGRIQTRKKINTRMSTQKYRNTLQSSKTLNV